MKKYLTVWFLCLALIVSLYNVSYARTTVGSNPTIDASTFTISPDGTSTNPSITFWNERTLGFYRSSTGVISITGGTLSMLGGSYSLTDSDVAHGMTDITATNVYGLLNALDAADKGGLRIQGLSDGDAIPLYIRGIIGSTNPTDTLEAISIVGAKKNGTGVQALGSTETVLQILNNTTELFTQTGDGSWRQPASTYHNFGATIGSTGLGFRDSSQVMQTKSINSSWENVLKPDMNQGTDAYIDPRDYKKISFFDGGIGVEWTQTSGTATAINDTTNVLKSYRGIAIPALNNDTIVLEHTPAAVLDLSTYDTIRMRFFINSAYPAFQDISAITLKFYNGSDYWEETTNLNNDNSNYPYDTGWNVFEVPKTAFSSGSGTINWNNITKITVTVDTTADPVNSLLNVTFNELSAFRNQLDRGVVIITFDDGGEETYTVARRYMDLYGYPGVAYIIGNLIGEITYMTVAQLQKLQNESGWDISSHTWSHLDMTTEADANVLESEFRQLQEYFKNNGIYSNHFAYPYGDWNATIETIGARYFQTMRLLSVSNNYSQNVHPAGNLKRLIAFGPDAATTLVATQAQVDTAESSKNVLILLFHRLNSAPTGSDWDDSDFADLMAYINTKNVDVMSMSGYLKKYHNKKELDDRYGGGTPGANLVTNSTFNDDLTGWAGANWVYSAGTALHTAGATTALSQAAATHTVNTWYKATFDIAGGSAGTVTFSGGGFTSAAHPFGNATGINYYYYATATTAAAFTPTNDFDGAVDNVYIRPISSQQIFNERYLTSQTGQPMMFNKVLSHATKDEAAYKFSYQTNKAAGNDTGVEIRQLDTASPGTSRMLDGLVGATRKFSVDNAGGAYFAGTLLVGTTSTTSTGEVNGNFNLTSAGQYYRVGGTGILTNDGADTILRGPTDQGVRIHAHGVEKYRLLTTGVHYFWLTPSDGTNYEGLSIIPASGNMTIAAATGGTGADNINITLTPAGTGTTTSASAITSPSSIITDEGTGNTSAAQMRGQTHKVTGAFTLSLPTAVVGYKAKYVASSIAAFSLDLQTGTDVIVLNGTALAAGNKATTDGTIYNTLEVECIETGKYMVNSVVGTSSDGGA